MLENFLSDISGKLTDGTAAVIYIETDMSIARYGYGFGTVIMPYWLPGLPSYRNTSGQGFSAADVPSGPRRICIPATSNSHRLLQQVMPDREGGKKKQN
jgi:hypothetical protein